MTFSAFRRIVTGHNPAGKSVILEDERPQRVRSISSTGPTFYEIWNTTETPARIDATSFEKTEDGILLTPPKNGTRIRVLDILPDGDNLKEMSPEQARAHFASIGAAEAASFDGRQPMRHAYMHRTETIDYGVVLSGELVLVMDEGETTVHAGDIIVQRGTNHGWANRSSKPCRIAFILIDGEFDESLVKTENSA